MKRSIIEHYFHKKLIIEKTMLAKKKSAHLMQLNESKSFDSIIR